MGGGIINNSRSLYMRESNSCIKHCVLGESNDYPGLINVFFVGVLYREILYNDPFHVRSSILSSNPSNI